MIRWVVALLAFALLPAVAVAQSARDIERAKESFKAGAAAYAAGEYLAAIQALDTAYALTPLPPIAFSLAQAERRQYFVARDRKHLDRAIVLYRRYLGQVPQGGRRADALDALAQLEAVAAARPAEASETAVEPERATRLMITCEAPGALISLDGGEASASPLIREVPAGSHRVAISAPGYFAAERELTAVVGELVPVEIALRERPSTLSVNLPADAQLYVDGALAGRGRPQVTVQLPSGSHRLVVAQKGHHASSQALVLGRGETRTLELALRPTAQRRASKWLFLGSGVALGAAATLGALALHFEGEAHGFLERRARGNVTAEELRDYDSDLTNRGRTRAAAAIALGASVGLLATGLLMYHLDNPPPQELFHSPETAAAPAPAARLRVSPVVMADGGGAQLHGRF